MSKIMKAASLILAILFVTASLGLGIESVQMKGSHVRTLGIARTKNLDSACF